MACGLQAARLPRHGTVKYPAAVTAHFFGHYLLSQGLITAPQLLAAVEYQQPRNTRLGELAVELGMMTAYDASRINALQAKEDLLFGEAAIKLQLLEREDVQRVLAAQQDLHVLLGQALVQLGYLDEDEVAHAVAGFEALVQRHDPEDVELPPDTPEAHLCNALFRLTHRLLTRSWGLANKPAAARVERGDLWLSDRNVRVPLQADGGLCLLVGVTHEIAVEAARPFAGEAPPGDPQMSEMVLQFGQVLAENLASVMAEQGRRLRPGQAQQVESRVPRPDSALTPIVPYVTQFGQVLVGLELP